jgi:uncharacterized membrane protein YhaH (DUF805 family)
MNWYLKVLKQFADFKGRARRKEYWMFTLFNVIITYGITLLGVSIEVPELETVSSIYSIVVLVPTLAVGVRRMHDVGKSGWYLLIPIYSLVLACTDSEGNTNKWGDNPKGFGNNAEIDGIGTE